MENKDDDHRAQQFKHCKPYARTTPEYSPISPQYTPFSLYYNPEQYEHPPYSPHFPAYNPTSPAYKPTRQDEHIRYFPTTPFYTPCSPPRYSSGKDAGHSTLPSFKPSMELRQSIKNQTDVALGITKQLLLTSGKNKNMVYSPLSIHIGLGMIMAGTKGHIQDRFLSFFKSKSMNELNDLASNVYPLVFADGYSKGGPRFSFPNAVWVEKSLNVKLSFKEVLDSTYKAALNEADFRARAEEVRCAVNSWVDKETNGLIREILGAGSVSSETKLLLANALYFKGTWIDKFNESKTEKFDFYLQSGSSVKTPFMTSSSAQCISVFESFKVLKLQYEQGEDYGRHFYMCLFLPNATDGLEALVQKICSDEYIDRYIPRGYVPVGKFLIPKFKIASEFKPLNILKPLGFSYEDGDLTEMVDGAVSLDMFHKSFIEVNEEGTEAAAVYYATSPGYSSGIKPSEPIPVDFVADHPFLYLIREEVTGTIMFMGHVLNPIEKFT